MMITTKSLRRVVAASSIILVWDLLLFQGKAAESLSSLPLPASPKRNLSPTSADMEFDAWCDRQGIFRVGVQTVTTPKSLGGRGLFATRDLKRGAVVASIPAELVIVEDHVDCDEWQVSLTKQVMALESSNEWIQSWTVASSTLPLETILAKHGHQDGPMVVEDFIRRMAGQGIITRQGAITALNDHMENYLRRQAKLPQQGLTCKWYALVLSRAAYLGKDWDYQVGAVPFFDMLNHCHNPNDANTELVNFGSCLDRNSASKKKEEDVAATEQRPSEDMNNVGLQRKDFLLVLLQDVKEGEELLTQYETNVEGSEDTQLKLLIQYGIPPP